MAGQHKLSGDWESAEVWKGVVRIFEPPSNEINYKQEKIISLKQTGFLHWRLVVNTLPTQSMFNYQYTKLFLKPIKIEHAENNSFEQQRRKSTAHKDAWLRRRTDAKTGKELSSYHRTTTANKTGVLGHL